MYDILLKAICFIAIIFIGYFLRKIYFFKENAFEVLSSVALKITLPAAIICNFNGRDIPIPMLGISLAGFLFGVILMAAGFIVNLKGSKKERAFGIINASGFNIGNFSMPFAQGFLGSSGVLVTSLFDVGNVFICLGGSYAIASSYQNGSGKFSIKPILKKLVTSVPFDTYIVMTALCLLHLKLPNEVISLASIISNANAFMAMLMIGVGFKLSGNKTQIAAILRIISVRYILAFAFSFACYFLLPFDYEIRKTLAIIVFAPVASAAPAFTGELKNDVGLSAAVNSISIVISIICLVGAIMLLA